MQLLFQLLQEHTRFISLTITFDGAFFCTELDYCYELDTGYLWSDLSWSVWRKSANRQNLQQKW